MTIDLMKGTMHSQYEVINGLHRCEAGLMALHFGPVSLRVKLRNLVVKVVSRVDGISLKDLKLLFLSQDID